MRSLLKHLRLSAAVAIAVGLAAGGIAYASIPDSNGVIHACYKASGAQATGGTPLKVVDTAAAACGNNEQEVTWNQTTSAYDKEGTYLLPGDDNAYTLATMSVPAGSFVVSATVDVNGTGSPETFVTCDIRGTGSAVLDASSTVTVADQEVAVPILGRSTGSTGTTLSLECRSTSQAVDTDGFMVATQIGSIHDE